MASNTDISSLETVEAAAEMLHNEYCTKLAELAEAVKQKYVVPFCDDHGLWFVSGMGSWSFDKLFGTPGQPDGPTSNDWDSYIGNHWGALTDPEDQEYYNQYKPPAGYELVRRMINATVPDCEYGLYLYMSDYKPQTTTK